MHAFLAFLHRAGASRPPPVYSRYAKLTILQLYLCRILWTDLNGTNLAFPKIMCSFKIPTKFSTLTFSETFISVISLSHQCYWGTVLIAASSAFVQVPVILSYSIWSCLTPTSQNFLLTTHREKGLSLQHLSTEREDSCCHPVLVLLYF